MAKSQTNRGGTRQRRSTNNNPEGHNQYDSGLMGMARERPVSAAAVAAGAVAAGVFLWSKRGQISDQISQLSDQIGEWTDTMIADSRSGRSNPELETVVGDSSIIGRPAGRIRTAPTARRNASNGASVGSNDSGSPVA